MLPLPNLWVIFLQGVTLHGSRGSRGSRSGSRVDVGALLEALESLSGVRPTIITLLGALEQLCRWSVNGASKAEPRRERTAGGSMSASPDGISGLAARATEAKMATTAAENFMFAVLWLAVVVLVGCCGLNVGVR